MSTFRSVMANNEVLSTVSLLDTIDDEDADYHDFKEAINSGNFSDEYNLTNTEVNRLSDENISILVINVLNSLFKCGRLIPLSEINEDFEYKLKLYAHFRALYKYYLNGRDLSEGEESVLNTAIKIMLWRIHCKTFRSICWFRYAYAARVPERRAYAKKYRSCISDIQQSRIKKIVNSLQAKFIRGFDDLPNRELRNYSIYAKGTKAIDVDYDRIVFDTYDYLDKLIGFKLSDIFYAIFFQYHQQSSDTRALKLAMYFKYGTDDTDEIWMLRYGMSFEDIEVIKPYVISIGQEELVLSPDIHNLPRDQIRSIERYI